MAQSNNTEAEIELEFQPTASPQAIPQSEEVRSTLVTGLNSTNTTSNLTGDTASITITSRLSLCRIFHNIASLQFGITATPVNSLL